MKVLVLKDGTIPVVVAEVIATDGDMNELAERTGDGDIAVEVFEVAGRPEALDVTWADGDGFSVYGTTVAEWFKNRQEDPEGGVIEPVPGGGGRHFVQSDIGHGEDEWWYSHLFILNGGGA